jgi:hypothetical protein
MGTSVSLVRSFHSSVGNNLGDKFNDTSSNNSDLTCSSRVAPLELATKGSDMALTVRFSPRGSTLYNLFPINVRPKYPLTWAPEGERLC